MMSTFKMNIPVFMALFFGLFLIACNEDSSFDLPENDGTTLELSEDESYYMAAASTREEMDETDEAHPTPFRHRKICIQPVFPLTLEFPNDSTLEVNSLRELKHVLHRWRHSGNDGFPQIAFPHDVELPDGSIVTVESREDVRELLMQCLKDRRPNLDSCYQIVFPIEVELGDGSMVTVNSKEELAELIRNWVPVRDSIDRPKIVFPIEIVLNDGSLDTVDSATELKEITKDCLPAKQPCFQWQYPITLQLADGNTVSIASRDEFIEFMKEYRQNNTGTDVPQVVFPQNVILQNGEVVTIDDPQELRRLKHHCHKKRDRRG